MIIIGDDIEKDVLGGNNIGIDSCYLNMKNKRLEDVDKNGTIKPTYIIKNLLELKEIL